MAPRLGYSKKNYYQQYRDVQDKMKFVESLGKGVEKKSEGKKGGSIAKGYNKYLGGAAGAGLGYILGDFGGSIAGGTVGYALGKRADQ
jgi:hypothetical protein